MKRGLFPILQDLKKRPYKKLEKKTSEVFTSAEKAEVLWHNQKKNKMAQIALEYEPTNP